MIDRKNPERGVVIVCDDVQQRSKAAEQRKKRGRVKKKTGW